jgi:hypothetical protein
MSFIILSVDTTSVFPLRLFLKVVLVTTGLTSPMELVLSWISIKVSGPTERSVVNKLGELRQLRCRRNPANGENVSNTHNPVLSLRKDIEVARKCND